MVHLGELDDNKAVNTATEAVNNYYFHMVNNASHWSKSFWKNLAVRFGALITYNTLPYTTSDTASFHNIEHQDCVNNLLYDLQLISNSVNRFVNKITIQNWISYHEDHLHQELLEFFLQ